MQPVARIHTDFGSKFAVPRQSGLAADLEAEIVMEPGFRMPEALRGIEEFSHLWLIWQFHQSEGWSPTVRPPKLGGNTRMGVFATRSPYRPNPIGLSCVKLLGTRRDEKLGIVLIVSGADLVDGTPILDIKPYLPYADSYPDASGGFTVRTAAEPLQVVLPESLEHRLPENKLAALREVLAQDPRPGYQHDPARRYGFPFAGLDIRFRVEEDRLTVEEWTELAKK